VVRQVVEGHDPIKSSCRQLGKRWVDLFHAKRAEYISDIDRIGIRHRLRALDRVAREAEAAKNRPLVLQAVEMAAKEVGDVFTNRRAIRCSVTSVARERSGQRSTARPAAATAANAADQPKPAGADYVYGARRILAVSTASEYFYHTDGLGSVVNLSTPAGVSVASYSYDPWGRPEQGALTAALTPFRFAGEELDNFSGLYYLRNRWYDPSTGRFLSRAKSNGYTSVPITLNKYVYGSGNPVSNLDPLELDVTITITRTSSTDNSIAGTITVTSSVSPIQPFSGYTLENASPPTNPNLPVPPGSYSAFIRDDYTPDKIQLNGVPDAAGIQIHNANNPGQVRGCFAVGTSASPDFVGHSVDALNAINNIIAADGSGNITVIVIGNPPAPPPPPPPPTPPSLSISSPSISSPASPSISLP
jgi:RHS repeat-associated protein